MNAEIEFAAEEQDADAVIGKAPESADVSLDGLDAGVEPLGQGVGDRVDGVVEQRGQMVLGGQSGLFDRPEVGASQGAEPAGEDIQTDGRARQCPQIQKVSLDARARMVFRSRARSSKRTARSPTTTSSPQHRNLVSLRRSSPAASNRRCFSLRTLSAASSNRCLD